MTQENALRAACHPCRVCSITAPSVASSPCCPLETGDQGLRWEQLRKHT